MYNLNTYIKDLNKVAKKEIPGLILDFENTEFIDSSAIGLIATVYKSINQYNGKFGLLNVKDNVLDILKLATIDTMFEIYNSEDEIEPLQ